MIQMKIKMIWKIAVIVVPIIFPYVDVGEFISGEINLVRLLIKLTIFSIIYLYILIAALTVNIQIDNIGLKGYVYKLSRIKSIENAQYALLWNKVESITSGMFPLWFPGKMIAVNFISKNGRTTSIVLTSNYSNFKKACLFIEKQVSPDIIADDVKRLIARYKKGREYQDIVFPIIIKDNDGYMYRIHSINDIEYNDLSFYEFQYFWDMRAVPLNIYLKERENSKSEIIIEIKEVLPEKEKLKSEIISFIKKYKKNINVKEIEELPFEKLVDKI